MKLLVDFAGIFSLFFVLTACQGQSTVTAAAPGLTGNETSPSVQITQNHSPTTLDGSPASTSTSISFKRLAWDTNGGGDLHYSITPADSAGNVFTLALSASSFHNYTNSYAIAPGDGDLYQQIRAVFYGQIQFTAPVTDPGMLTGTGSILRLYDLSDTETTYPSPVITTAGQANLFDAIRSYIDIHLSNTSGT